MLPSASAIQQVNVFNLHYMLMTNSFCCNECRPNDIEICRPISWQASCSPTRYHLTAGAFENIAFLSWEIEQTCTFVLVFCLLRYFTWNSIQPSVSVNFLVSQSRVLFLFFADICSLISSFALSVQSCLRPQ